MKTLGIFRLPLAVSVLAGILCGMIIFGGANTNYLNDIWVLAAGVVLPVRD